MGLYYSTDMVLRWYKADDSQLKQDRGRTQYTAISNDALVDLREHGIAEDNVRHWLEENHVPPDGYASPYDGTILDDALAQMTKSTADARAVTRAYSLLRDEGDDEQENFIRLYYPTRYLRCMSSGNYLFQKKPKSSTCGVCGTSVRICHLVLPNITDIRMKPSLCSVGISPGKAIIWLRVMYCLAFGPM